MNFIHLVWEIENIHLHLCFAYYVKSILEKN